MSPIVIDGSMGEGGGQILRSSLALSVATGRPFSIHSIRAKRKKPGLLRQHLTAVKAAARISSASVSGAEPGSQKLTFEPGALCHGTYELAVGTAGSTTLVLQTILPPLLFAKGSSRIFIEGGTHNPLAPPFEHLSGCLLPLLLRLGARVSVSLEAYGFAPAGGGKLVAEIEGGDFSPTALFDRGSLIRRSARALVANLPEKVAHRELHVVREELGLSRDEIAAETVKSAGPGNVLVIDYEFTHGREIVVGFGERGKRAEEVARSACAEMKAYLESDAFIGRHLADQVMVPLALCGKASFSTLPLSLHAKTNLEVIKMFLPDLRVRVEERPSTTVSFG